MVKLGNGILQKSRDAAIQVFDAMRTCAKTSFDRSYYGQPKDGAVGQHTLFLGDIKSIGLRVEAKA